MVALMEHLQTLIGYPRVLAYPPGNLSHHINTMIGLLCLLQIV